jgi:hypothetical protein
MEKTFIYYLLTQPSPAGEGWVRRNIIILFFLVS